MAHLFGSVDAIKTNTQIPAVHTPTFIYQETSMKVRQGFNLRKVCGENIIVAEGRENIDFSKIISMNESSAYLWEAVKDKTFTIEELASLLTAEYDVDADTAEKDAKDVARQWLEAGIIEK